MSGTTGIIVKGVGGFYYVETSSGNICECKARGVFRKKSLSPLVGDNVVISQNEQGFASIDEILPRKNSLIRPPIANVDRLFIISSVAQPQANVLLIDKMTVLASANGIEPVVVFSKTDIKDPTELEKIYKTAGIQTISCSAKTGAGIEKVRASLDAHISVFTGNSGVGKSSLLNVLFENLNLATGDISKKLGRGRHTTRHVELFKTGQTSYIADTPGFSMVELQYCQEITKENLQHCFCEFDEYVAGCKFNSCSHRSEKGCAVRAGVQEGGIHPSRYQSYLMLYEELEKKKAWAQK